MTAVSDRQARRGTSRDIRRIGILTSGGDCPGLNAVIRAVVHRAIQSYGWEVVGIREGTAGLLARPVMADPLDLSIFTGTLLREAGTILGTTNRGDPFAYPTDDGRLVDRSAEVVEGYRMLDLDALIGVGGDGSLRILSRLAREGGIPLVAIPKTIDNDIGLTEVSVGYWSAVTVAARALDHLQPTAASHSRVMVLEVMGRDAGHIAIAAGIAGGADVILIPEIPYDMDRVAARIAAKMAHRPRFALVVVAEAARPATPGASAGGTGDAANPERVVPGGAGHLVAAEIAARTGAETRVTVLGHLQRGGPPTVRDRLMASVFGVRAVDLVAEGRFGRMVAWQNRNVVDVAIEDAVGATRRVDLDGPLVTAARGLGVCLGD